MSFDVFWLQYPRRVGKLDAHRAYDKALKLATVDEILAGVQRYALATSQSEMQFIKHPATWLRAGCWMDDAEAIAPARAPARGLNRPDFDALARYYDAQSQREGGSGPDALPLLQDLSKRPLH